MKSLRARTLSITGLLAALLLLWACYPASEVTYSNPQNTVNEWLIELRPGDAKLQLTMNYRRTGDTGFNYHNTDFGIELDQLVGLTRDQVMSAMGTNVHFQLKRDLFIFDIRCDRHKPELLLHSQHRHVRPGTNDRGIEPCRLEHQRLCPGGRAFRVHSERHVRLDDHSEIQLDVI